MIKINPLVFLFSVVGGIIVYMGLYTWSELPKNQTNNQKISEAISEAIAQHEADPEAHLGAGESLEQHKTNEVIDHPAFSVLKDKISFDRNVISVPFYTLSNLDVSSGCEVNGVDTLLMISSTLHRDQFCIGHPNDIFPSSMFYYTKNPRISFDVAQIGFDDSQWRIMVGDLDESQGFGFIGLEEHVYFEWWDNNENNYTTFITDLISGVPVKLEARILWPSIAQISLNGAVVKTLTNLSLPSTNPLLWSCPWIASTFDGSGSVQLFVRNFYWEADP